MVGKELAHYTIIEKLGEGGMGVVWKAHDTHLDRFVALKLLPQECVLDSVRKSRFIQEAKAASALNHPSIVTVHDIADSGGTLFIAMEYVQGKTLDQLIGRKGLKLGTALKYAVQIADALAKAHSAGIVHRDLKPSNIMITDDGLVKILDFGLAKLTESADRESASTQILAPDGKPLTEQGLIVGTAAYMSPEQVEGKDVDARSDMFSFGCVLYEMITGRRAFQGETKMSTLSAILHREPPPAHEIVADLPREVESIIARCLRKDRERRIQNMRDLKLVLEELKEQSDSGTLVSAPPRATTEVRHVRWLIPALIGILLIAVVVWLGLTRSKSAVPPRTIPITTYRGLEIHPAFSPDGKQVAFVWNGENQGGYDLYVKLIDAGSPLRLTNHPGHYGGPAWSPDGRYIACIRRAPNEKPTSEVFIVPALGGPERKLGQAAPLQSEDWKLAWSPDGKWLVVPQPGLEQYTAGLSLLSIETGERKRLTSTPLTQSWADGLPAFSADGRTLAFVRILGPWTGDIYALPLNPDATPAGDPKRLTFDNRYVTGLDWTPDGHNIVFSSNRAGPHNLWRVPAAGGPPQQLSGGGDDVYDVSIARQNPTGVQRLLYARVIADNNIWRIGRSGGAPTRLIASTQDDYHPRYSPDGNRIAFGSKRSGSEEIWVSNSDGSNPVQLTSFGGPATGAPRWSPDGRRLAFDSRKEAGHADIYVISADGGSPRKITTEPSDEVRPSWSTDGRFVYFASNRKQGWQIWKAPAAGGAAEQVTRNGGREAFESADGKILYYVKEYAPGVWSVPVNGGEETAVMPQGWSGNWALFPEGIYWLNHQAPSVEFFSFAKRQSSSLVALPYDARAVTFTRGFAMSPDAKWVLYQQADFVESDIMMIENFR